MINYTDNHKIKFETLSADLSVEYKLHVETIDIVKHTYSVQ